MGYTTRKMTPRIAIRKNNVIVAPNYEKGQNKMKMWVCRAFKHRM